MLIQDPGPSREKPGRNTFKILFQNCKPIIYPALEFSLIWHCSLTSESLSDINVHTHKTSLYCYLTKARHHLFKGQDGEIVWTYVTGSGNIFFNISHISILFTEKFSFCTLFTESSYYLKPHQFLLFVLARGTDQKGRKIRGTMTEWGWGEC